MRWTPRGRSSNLEDRRSGGGIGTSLGVGGTVVVLILSLVFGRNLFTDLGVDPRSTLVQSTPMTAAESTAQEPMVEFVSFVLDDAQETWRHIFQQAGTPYQDARLVLFRNAVSSGCGSAQSAMGPFYCPLDQRVYIDLGFYDELENRFGAPGDFAQAYVLAHEIGHHIQNLLGTEAEVRRAQQANPQQANELSVQMELQADCYAGIWGHSMSQRDSLDRGDVDEGLAAAAAVGDDRIQQQQTGQVAPESFTHGSAAQRSAWFKRGFESGDPRQCDTFGAR